MGNLIARANASSIMYSQAGTYTCTAERPNENPVEKTLIVTVQCGKRTSIRNFYSYGYLMERIHKNLNIDLYIFQNGHHNALIALF